MCQRYENHETYVSLYFSEYRLTRFIDNCGMEKESEQRMIGNDDKADSSVCYMSLTGIDFFDNVEIRFIVGVLHAATSPWNRTQLSRGQSPTYAVKIDRNR